MKKILLAFLLLLSTVAGAATGSGIISRPSQYPVPETIARLEAVLKEKGLTVFARIDHAGEAQKAGLKMRPAQLLVFGNPKAGNPVMQAAPLAGLDLPLKVLVWQDAEGKTWLSYNDPAYLQQRFGLSDEQAKPIAGIGGLVNAALK